MKGSRWLFIALFAAVGLWWWLGQGGDDEQQIRAQLDRVAELISKERGEKALESADRARRLADFFTEEFAVNLDPVGVQITNAAEMVRPFVGLRHQADELTASFDVEELEVGDELPVASMSATGTVSGQVQGRPQSATFKISVAWKKQGGTWRIETFHVTERVDGGFFN